MNKADWYKHIIGRADQAIADEYFFEAAFICYGIIEDRLNSMMDIYGKPVGRKGVAKKVKELLKVRSNAAEDSFKLDKWDGGKYKKGGYLSEAVTWGELYRNPMQHHLGDPRHYKASVGNFHNDVTKDLAVEGVRVARALCAAVMRYKKKAKKIPQNKNN